MRGTTFAFAALALGAYTYRTEVPPVDGSALAGVGARQAGRFADPAAHATCRRDLRRRRRLRFRRHGP